MSWSYDPTDLNTTTASGRLNTVRYLVGDNDTDNQQVQNEEVNFSLSETNNNVYFAASNVAMTLASKYASKVTLELDEQLKAEYGELYSHYMSLTLQLTARAKQSGSQIGVKAGGISKTKVGVVRSNTDRVEPAFRRDRFTNPQNTDQYS